MRVLYPPISSRVRRTEANLVDLEVAPWEADHFVVMGCSFGCAGTDYVPSDSCRPLATRSSRRLFSRYRDPDSSFLTYLEMVERARKEQWRMSWFS